MAKEEMKYEQAVRELEQIVERMENDELDIDQLSEQLKRAKTLVKLCKDKLTKTDEEIKKLLSVAVLMLTLPLIPIPRQQLMVMVQRFLSR